MATPKDIERKNEPAIKSYERALFDIAISVNRVRNKEGTGHGKLYATALNTFESTSIIEAVGIVTEFLLNRLNQSD